MSDSTTRRSARRHPSAGNLDAKPALVREGEAPAPLPPASFPHGAPSHPGVVQLGPDLDHDTLQRLLGAAGPIEGLRVLDLGCGAAGSSIALARQGARVVAVDASTARLARARVAAEDAEVRIEFHHSDLADLAFVRADSIDLVVAVYSLAGVQDLGRVFRQLHRIMRPDAALVLSLPHPMSMMLELEPDEQQTPYLTRTFWTDHPLSWRAGGDEGQTFVHQVSEVFTTLVRSNFRVDTVLELGPGGERRSIHNSPLADWVPSTLIVRGRKEGSWSAAPPRRWRNQPRPSRRSTPSGRPRPDTQSG
ncbi:MAG: class I SAM-dependent methyltransferase [Actinomycetes bacterium]